MSATRAAQDQIVLALLTAHLADDHDLRRDLLVDAWGPAASDDAVGEGIDALVRLIASLRAALARSGTDNAMALPSGPTGRDLCRLVTTAELAAAGRAEEIGEVVVIERHNLAELAMLALDTISELTERAATRAGMDTTSFIRQLALRVAAEAAS